MSLRSQHDEMLADHFEDKSKCGEDITLDLSADDLEWYDGDGEVPDPSTVALVGETWLSTQEVNPAGEGVSVTTQAAWVRLRLSTLLGAFGCVPGVNLGVSFVDSKGVTRTFIVERGGIRVYEVSGIVVYILTEIETV